jgi:OFA family oxalate/formate antiporter-like MFS transporter
MQPFADTLRSSAVRRDQQDPVAPPDAPSRWVPLAGCMLLNVVLGAFYAWSVFVLPLERAFGWSRTDTAGVFTVAIITTVACFVTAGRVQDRRGPRACAILGTSCLSLGFFLTSFTTSLAWLYASYGIVVGLGNGIGYAVAVPVVSKWFPDKRGLAVGLTVGAYGGGSAVLGPLSQMLISELGWRTTFRILAALFLIGGAAATLLVRNPPPGYRAPNATAIRQRSVAHPDVSTAAMLRDTTFYALWVAYCLGATAGMMTISQLVPFARSAGFDGAAATFALTVGALGNASGRILAGWLSDKIGRLATLRMMVLGAAVAMPALFAWRTQLVPFYVLVAAVYWCYGTLLSVFASTSADFYGTRDLGLNYGILFTGLGTAGVLGPLIGARTFDAFGDYQVAFLSASALALIAFASLWFARPPAATARLDNPLAARA